MAKFRLYTPNVSYRGRRRIVIIGLIIGLASLAYTNNLARQLRNKEASDVGLWSYVWSKFTEFNPNDPLYVKVMESNSSIPFIITNEDLEVKAHHLVPEAVINNRELLRRKLEHMANINEPIEINLRFGRKFLVFYDRSNLLKSLYYFPYVQISVIAAFVMLSFLAFSSSKQNEQNRVWVGMAKETAHQLGTPISSLLGWAEYLKNQDVDPMVTEEMNKDLTRLLKIVDRFSKIGAVTSFSERDVVSMVGDTVAYFRTRIPKNVEIRYSQPPAPLYAMINEALFEWVIENLLKNALDALQGKGEILVSVKNVDKWINIDVKDNGKGMSKASFQKIFEPGYTTKTRGWGLGLSLSRRIIEEYHKGRIYVVESETDKGTTMRVALRRADFWMKGQKKSLFAPLTSLFKKKNDLESA